MKHKILFGVIGFVAALGGFLFGFDTAVVSGTLIFVKAQFALNAISEGWFVSSALVGSITGVAIAGILSDIIGRKKVLVISALLFAATAIGCMLAVSEAQLILFRFVGGLGIGIASIVSPMYLSEISPARIRGKMVSLYQMAITIGILTIYISNLGLLNISNNQDAVVHNDFFRHILKEEVWRSMFGVGIIPAVIFLLLLFTIPESPRWLMKKNLRSRALKALGKTRPAAEAEKEINEIDQSGPGSRISAAQLLRYKKPIFIGIVFAFLVQFSGITAVIYYGAKILNIASGGLDSAYSGQMLIGIINVLFTLIAIFFIDKIGRRKLTIIGAALSLVCHTCIGLLFFLDRSQSVWLPVFILLYTAAFAASYGPVFWTVISEIYPNQVRGTAMSIAAFANWIATALVAQLIPWMLEKIQPSGTFWVFALCSVPALFFALKVLPETKGKTLEEIEKFW